jgi:hypothetical protein
MLLRFTFRFKTLAAIVILEDVFCPGFENVKRLELI